MDKLETRMLGRILLCNTMEEQIDILLKLGIKDFESDKARKYLQIFNDVLFKKRIKIDQVSLYEHVRYYEGFDISEFTKLTEGLNHDLDEIIADYRLLKERGYKAEVLKIIVEGENKIKKSITLEEFEDNRERLIVDLNGKDLNTTSTFINPVEFVKKIDDNLSKEKALEGPSWGLTELDVYTNGIETPRLIVLGGLKKSGKTKFVINTRYQLYKQNIVTPFLSLEMPGYEITKQTISRFAEIPEPYLRAKSFMNQEQREKYETVKKEINWALLPTEVANSLDVYQIIGRIRRYAKLYPGSIVFIDYLQRVKHDRNKQSFELENISNLIADATRENNVTVVLLSQLSNAAETQEELSIGHLKGSGGIGESADTIILLDNLYRRKKLDETLKGVIKLQLEQRYGDSAKLEIHSDLSCCKFYDTPREWNKPMNDKPKNKPTRVTPIMGQYDKDCPI